MIDVLIIDDAQQKAEEIKSAIENGYGQVLGRVDIAKNQVEGRNMMSNYAYDVLVLDLMLPFDDKSQPELDGGVKFLNLLQHNIKLKLPLQVIGVTEYEDSFELGEEEFHKFLFSVVFRKQGDSSWRDKLLQVIGFVSRAKESMLETLAKRNKYDVLIVCALREELEELLNAFGRDTWQKVCVTGQKYMAYETNIETSSMENYKVLAFSSDKSGVTATSVMASYLIHCYSPKCLFMTGITGGIAHGNLKCGDVVIADSVQDYATGKIEMYKGEQKTLQEIHQIPSDMRLLSQITDYISDDENILRLNLQIKKNHLQHDDENYNVYIGPSVCGPFVVASEEYLKQIKDRNRKIIAIDMEGFGIMMSSYLLNVPSLWIKGVSDMANLKKDDSYHATAAFASAKLLYGFLKDGLVL